MAKIKNPALFSKQFNVNPDTLHDLGVLNPVLNADTRLFIDPLLFEKSKHIEISTGAVASYRNRFSTLIKLLAASKSENDVPWRNAYRFFDFPEIQGTCLGYGASSIHGSAWGAKLRKQVLATAKEIVDLGITDPDLFMALALFEEGIGPDRISDMATNIIIQDLINFNQNLFKKFQIPLKKFEINGICAELPQNPLETKTSPIILVPTDILGELPVALDWSGVSDAAHKSKVIRNSVNSHIAEIWKSTSRRDKQKLKEAALSSSEAFSTLLNALHSVDGKPYNLEKDRAGQVAWTRVLEKVANEHPLTFSLKATPSIDDVFKVVQIIVQQFARLVEQKGLWKELWADTKPRHESSAQRIFFAVADSYCKANNVDITPEADSGGGPVDFKFSTSYDTRVLVEIKLSTNPNVVSGYDTQLEIYKGAEETTRAIYLVIDVGKMGKKDEKILAIKNNFVKEGRPVSEIVFVDGKKKLSASKR
ncbi:hypothetical protein GALL_19910 [mine drainage metagenome]|uniref:Uncharacterized protein n=1 Tax=mine drainage metagenome TaxID=410659 RepID=A0A1J5TA95_9ZZZZ